MGESLDGNKNKFATSLPIACIGTHICVIAWDPNSLALKPQIGGAFKSNFQSNGWRLTKSVTNISEDEFRMRPSTVSQFSEIDDLIEYRQNSEVVGALP